MELVIDGVDSLISTPLDVSNKVVRITQLYLMFLFTWQSYFRVSDVGMNTLLVFLATFLQLLVTAFGI